LPWLWAEASQIKHDRHRRAAARPHKVKIELVDANHNVFPGQVVVLKFTVPSPAK
jgi:hypothetical protein